MKTNNKIFSRCPCCGYATLPSRNNYEICYLCSWQDDGQDDEDSDQIYGGPNRDYSLDEARMNFRQKYIMFRPSDPDFLRLRNDVIDNIKLQIMKILDTKTEMDDTTGMELDNLIKLLRKERSKQFNETYTKHSS